MLVEDDDEASHNCNSVSEAIRFQGIDDFTSWAFVQACFIMVYSVLLVVGFIGNGSVLMMFAQNKRLRSTRNLFLLNLIITDLLLCLTAIPVTPWYALTKDWKFGAVMCRLVPLSSSCAVFVTSWSLTAIAIDKFWHIMDPTRGRFSLRLAGFVTLLIWSVPSVINIPYLLSYELVDGSYYVPKDATPFCGHFCDELNWQSDTQRRLYGCAVLIFQFVVPMAVITYCYSRILRKVHKDMIVQNSQFSGSLTDAQRLSAINRKKRVNYILIGMVVAFIGCNTPLTALNLAKDFTRYDTETEPEFMRSQPYLWPLIAHLIAMSAVVWNPFLFFWLTTKEKPIRTGNFGGLGATTSEILNSLASRVQSFRSISGDSINISRSKRQKLKTMNKTELMVVQNGRHAVYYPPRDSSGKNCHSLKNGISLSSCGGGAAATLRSSPASAADEHQNGIFSCRSLLQEIRKSRRHKTVDDDDDESSTCAAKKGGRYKTVRENLLPDENNNNGGDRKLRKSISYCAT